MESLRGRLVEVLAPGLHLEYHRRPGSAGGNVPSRAFQEEDRGLCKTELLTATLAVAQASAARRQWQSLDEVDSSRNDKDVACQYHLAHHVQATVVQVALTCL